MVKPICCAPFNAACSGGSPCSMWRVMFSIMTMASSTTKPVAMVSAIKVRLLRLKPASAMTANVPTSDSGTAAAGIRVAGTLRKNRKITSTTSATASTSSNCTSRKAARMVTVRSDSKDSCTAPGRLACSRGSMAWMRSTVSITFAPGWRCTLRMMARRSFDQAARRAFSAPSTTSATLPRRMAAPFFQATISARYSSTERSWSLASSVEARVGPSKLPLAPLTLAAAMALRTSSRPMPAAASASGLACTRTAGRTPPAMLTRPTPLICDSFCATRVSISSWMRGSGSVSEVMARVTMGASAGLTLL